RAQPSLRSPGASRTTARAPPARPGRPCASVRRRSPVKYRTAAATIKRAAASVLRRQRGPLNACRRRLPLRRGAPRRAGYSWCVATPTRTLCEFLAGFTEVPPEVVARAKELFVDWLGAALAGRGEAPVRALAAVATRMGPGTGPSELLPERG